MRFIKSFIFSLFLIIFLPSTILAREIIKEEDGERCIDLEAAYADINDSSKALTGQDNSVDAVKKANTVASLTNIISIIIGDRIYCVKDEIAATNVESLNNSGLLGFLESANSNMLAYFPTVSISTHLAENFIPGYSDKNSVLAISFSEYNSMSEADKEKFFKSLESMSDDEKKKEFETWADYELEEMVREMTISQSPILQLFGVRDEEGQFNSKIGNRAKTKFSGVASNVISDAENQIKKAEEAVPTGNKVDKSGYNYLKDNLKLDSIWGVFRNIAYLGYVVIMIVVGFMIMLRKNLPGQVVVSLGNTIPQIIFGLVLVTFSFAIVGIVMDIGKVSMNVTSNIFSTAYSNASISTNNSDEIVSVESVGSLTDQALKKAKKDGLVVSAVRKLPFIGDRIADFLSGTSNTVLSIVKQSSALLTISFLTDTVEEEDVKIDAPGVLSIIGANTITDVAVEIGELILDMSMTVLRAGLIPVLIRNVLLLLVCLYASFKLFITMLMTYLKLFINVIFGPIQIMLGSLPGNFSSTTKWFKSVIANVFTFVGIYLVINVFAFISSAVDPAQFNFFGNKGVFWPDWIVSLEGVILIAGYLFAANMPTIINGALKIEQSKEMSMVGQSVQKAAGKIPFIGGMFNG